MPSTKPILGFYRSGMRQWSKSSGEEMPVQAKGNFRRSGQLLRNRIERGFSYSKSYETEEDNGRLNQPQRGVHCEIFLTKRFWNVARIMSFFNQSRKLPSPTTSKDPSPKGSPKGSPMIATRKNPRESSQIPVRKNSGSSKPAPLLRSRSREFMDAVKKFEGGKLPEKLLKTVDEEKRAVENQLAACENDLIEIRKFIDKTKEDFKGVRSQTKKLRSNLSELHNLHSWQKSIYVGYSIIISFGRS